MKMLVKEALVRLEALAYLSGRLGRPKIHTFFRINALFWPTDLPIPLSIPAKFPQMMPLP